MVLLYWLICMEPKFVIFGSVCQYFSGIMQISDRTGNTVSRVLHDLLQSGDSAQKYMQRSRSTKKNDSLIQLDNVMQSRDRSLGARVRALQAQSKRCKKHMSMKQHRKCGSLDLPREFYK